MHYSSHGFSVNGEPTIVTHDPQFQDLIGQRASYTADDIDYINLLYSYNEDDQAREIRASKFFYSDVGTLSVHWSLDKEKLDSCTCNTIEIFGMNIQTSRNGLYFVDRDVVSGHRQSFLDYSVLFSYVIWLDFSGNSLKIPLHARRWGKFILLQRIKYEMVHRQKWCWCLQ